MAAAANKVGPKIMESPFVFHMREGGGGEYGFKYALAMYFLLGPAVVAAAAAIGYTVVTNNGWSAEGFEYNLFIKAMVVGYLPAGFVRLSFPLAGAICAVLGCQILGLLQNDVSKIAFAAGCGCVGDLILGGSIRLVLALKDCHDLYYLVAIPVSSVPQIPVDAAVDERPPPVPVENKSEIPCYTPAPVGYISVTATAMEIV